MDLLASSCSTQCQHYFTLETPLPLGALELNAFSHPWKFQVSYVFPPLALVPLVLSKFLAEHVNGQLRHLLLVAPCWMEAPWLPTVLNMLVDVPWQCPLLKNLILDVLVGQALKVLQYLHLTLWLLSNMCYADRGSLPWSVRQWQGQLHHLHQGSTNNAGRSGPVVCLTGFTKQCPLCPKLANFLFHLFQVGLAWHTIGIYHSAISAFLEPHHIHKASNHPVISKLMHYFIYSSLLLINGLILGMWSTCYLFWKVGHLHLPLLPLSPLGRLLLCSLVWWQDRSSGSSSSSDSY